MWPNMAMSTLTRPYALRPLVTVDNSDKTLHNIQSKELEIQ